MQFATATALLTQEILLRLEHAAVAVASENTTEIVQERPFRGVQGVVQPSFP